MRALSAPFACVLERHRGALFGPFARRPGVGGVLLWSTSFTFYVPTRFRRDHVTTTACPKNTKVLERWVELPNRPPTTTCGCVGGIKARGRTLTEPKGSWEGVGCGVVQTCGRQACMTLVYAYRSALMVWQGQRSGGSIKGGWPDSKG